MSEILKTIWVAIVFALGILFEVLYLFCSDKDLWNICKWTVCAWSALNIFCMKFSFTWRQFAVLVRIVMICMSCDVMMYLKSLMPLPTLKWEIQCRLSGQLMALTENSIIYVLRISQNKKLHFKGQQCFSLFLFQPNNAPTKVHYLVKIKIINRCTVHALK